MNVDRYFPRTTLFLSCIVLLAGCQESTEPAFKHSGDMVLAISWQPGFCESRPGIPECRTQTPERYDASRFSLHGLWPQPGNRTYCSVSPAEKRRDTTRRWKRLESLQLPADMRQRLEKVMPGTLSYLHRHEWIKHGTCYADTPENYYRDSLLLIDQINASAVQNLFHDSIGRQLTSSDIRQAFDAAFGRGAGNRVRISCKRDGKRILITGLTLSLSDRVSADTDLQELIHAAPTTRPGCPAGVVDATGLQ